MSERLSRQNVVELIIKGAVPDGRIAFGKTENLTFDECQSFIEDILLEKHTVLDFNPSYAINTVYKKMDTAAQAYFQEILLLIMEDLAEKRQAIWLSEAGKYLLISVAVIFSELEIKKREKPIALAKKILTEWNDFQGSERDLYWRAGFVLNSLHFQATEDFWYMVLEKGGEEFGGMVFGGLENTHLHSAFAWLKKNIHNTSAVDTLMRSLPYLVEKYGKAKLGHLVSEVLPLVDVKQHKEIGNKARRLGLEVTR